MLGEKVADEIDNTHSMSKPDKLDAFSIMKQRRKNREDTEDGLRKKTKADSKAKSITVLKGSKDFFKPMNAKEATLVGIAKNLSKDLEIIQVDRNFDVSETSLLPTVDVAPIILEQAEICITGSQDIILLGSAAEKSGSFLLDDDKIESDSEIVEIVQPMDFKTNIRKAKLAGIQKQAVLIETHGQFNSRGEESDSFDCQFVGSSNKKKTSKNSFFLTKQERREHIMAEKMLKLHKANRTRNLISTQVSVGKKMNPFFDQREAAQVKVYEKRPLVDAPWPSEMSFHVSRGLSTFDWPALNLPLKSGPSHFIFGDDHKFPILFDDTSKLQKQSIVLKAKTVGDLAAVKSGSSFAEYPDSYNGLRRIPAELWSAHWYDLPNISSSKILGQILKWFKNWKPSPSQELQGAIKLAKQRRNAVDDFMNDFSSDEDELTDVNSPIIIIQGPTGCGKSSIVHKVASVTNRHLLELNCSQKRTAKEVSSLILEGVRYSARIDIIYFLDDVDILFEDEKGFWTAALDLALSSKFPIILTCTDNPFKKPNPNIPPLLRELVDSSTRFDVSYLCETDVKQLLTASAYSHGFLLGENVLGNLSSSNARQLINDLQFLCTGSGYPPTRESWLLLTGLETIGGTGTDIYGDEEYHNYVEFRSNLNIIGNRIEDLNQKNFGHPQGSDWESSIGSVIEVLNRIPEMDLEHIDWLQDFMWYWKLDWRTQKLSSFTDYLPYFILICRYDLLNSGHQPQRRARRSRY